MEVFIDILQAIGVISFAAAGALTAMKKHMDLLGVIVMGVTASVGGGILRDVLLGITPPNAFLDPTSAIIAVAVSIILFIPQIRHGLMHNQKAFDLILFGMDSIGLGVFTVMGIWITLEANPDRSTFLLTFVGVITGVGGGILRDIFAGDTPYIFTKHIYASASLLGALACIFLMRVLPDYIAMSIGAFLVIVIRILSAHYRWNLPTVKNV